MAGLPSPSHSPISDYKAYDGGSEPPAYPGGDARTVESGVQPSQQRAAAGEAGGEQSGDNGDVRVCESIAIPLRRIRRSLCAQFSLCS